jgi:hypothetical protein
MLIACVRPQSVKYGANIQQLFELCECTATFLHEKQKKVRFSFVIREIMIIFAPIIGNPIERTTIKKQI